MKPRRKAAQWLFWFTLTYGFALGLQEMFAQITDDPMLSIHYVMEDLMDCNEIISNDSTCIRMILLCLVTNPDDLWLHFLLDSTEYQCSINVACRNEVLLELQRVEEQIRQEWNP